MIALRDLTADDDAQLLEMLHDMYPSISAEVLADRHAVIADSAWRCIGAFASDELVGMAGYWIQMRFCYGRFLYVDHFYLAPRCRGTGLASRFVQLLRERAREARCERLCLDTFVSNHAAQRAWFKAGFSIEGFHFGQLV